MKALLIAALIAAPSLAFADCPPVAERDARYHSLMADVAKAPDQNTAQHINSELWRIWTTAPDEVAQELLNSGMEKRRIADYRGAIETLDRLVEYCPHYAEGYNQRAFVQFLSQNYEASLADLNETLAIVPDHIGAHSGRALVFFELGEEYHGQIALRQALALNPWLPERFRLKPLEAEPEPEKSDL